MKVGDLVKIVTYRNSGETEAIGVFLDGALFTIRKEASSMSMEDRTLFYLISWR